MKESSGGERERRPIMVHDDERDDSRSLKQELRRLRERLREERAARLRAETALAESEERYAGTMQSALVGIYIIQDLKFRYVNPTMAAFFGYRPEEMVGGLGPTDLLVPEQRAMVARNLQQRAHGEAGHPYEVTCLRRDGSRFDAMVWGKGVTLDGRPASVGTMMDISTLKQVQRRLEHHQAHLQEQVAQQTGRLRRTNRQLQQDIRAREEAEAALRTSEHRLRGLINATEDDMVMLFDRQLRVVVANETAARTFGSSVAALTGKRASELFDTESGDNCQQRLLSVLSEGESRRLERLLADHWYDINLCPVPGSGGRPTAVAMFARDITQRKLIEQAFERSKEEAERANQAKSRFLAAANHDLRQPLQAMSLLLGAIGFHDLDRRTQALVGDMKNALRVMESLLNALLDISKLEAGTIVPEPVGFPVQPFLEHLQSQFRAQAAEHGITIRIRPTDAVIHTDPVLLGRILQNFLSNAIRHCRGDRVLIGCRPAGTGRRIEVWNPGEGIPEQEQERIFEEFYQLGNPARNRDQGLGLGLAIAKRMADLLQLRLGVRSREGVGAVFSVDVPGADPQSRIRRPHADRPATVARPRGQGAVLVVDDDKGIRAAMGRLLELWGYRVFSAGGGESALQLVRRHGSVIDCAFLDYRLPDGWNGVSLYREICRLADRTLPTTLVTGDTAAKWLQEVQESRLPLLHKPVDADTLLQALDRMQRQE